MCLQPSVEHCELWYRVGFRVLVPSTLPLATSFYKFFGQISRSCASVWWKVSSGSRVHAGLTCLCGELSTKSPAFLSSNTYHTHTSRPSMRSRSAFFEVHVFARNKNMMNIRLFLLLREMFCTFHINFSSQFLVVCHSHRNSISIKPWFGICLVSATVVTLLTLELTLLPMEWLEQLVVKR